MYHIAETSKSFDRAAAELDATVKHYDFALMTSKFEKDGHCIYWLDTLETLRTELPAESVDLIFVCQVHTLQRGSLTN